MMKKYEGIAWIDISVRYLFEVQIYKICKYEKICKILLKTVV